MVVPNEDKVLRRISAASSASKATVRSIRKKSRPVSTYFSRVARHVMNKPNNLRRSTLALHRMNSKQRGHEGFDDLRVFVKNGSEFTKELAATLNERAELEISYAKGLAKLSAKLFKSAKDMNGTVSNAWHFIAEDMEASAETHKTISNLFVEDLVKPLRMFVESQHRTRKSMEGLVDKRSRSLLEWRSTEAKAKVKCYANCKDNERVQDQVLDCKLGRGRVLSDKELLKLEGKRKKSEEAVRKSDLDYYACCLKSERARLEWETAVLRGCSVFRQMEEERLEQLKHLAEQYHQTMAENRPKLVACSRRLEEPILNCEVARDMEAVNKKVEIDADALGDQLLPSFYSEDQTNAMNMERRRDALTKFLRVIKSDIEREKKGKAGVENLAKALRETPKFGGEDSQQDVQEKLQHMRSMLTFLEACRFKVLNSLLELEGRSRIAHPLSSYIATDKDKSGMIRTVLRIPYNIRQESQPALDYAYPSSSSSSSSLSIAMPDLTSDDCCRGTADGGFSDQLCLTDFATAVLEADGRGLADGGDEATVVGGVDDGEDSSDFDDFSDGEQVNIIEVVNGGGNGNRSSSDHGDKEVDEIYIREKTAHSAASVSGQFGHCTAIYDYAANMYDELSIKVGDVINIHDKQADGWWLGELRGTVGIFPATYVEED